MPLDIHYFGNRGLQKIILGDGTTDGEVTVVLRRELWFDHDIDGRWLIWAQGDAVKGANGEADEAANLGAIIITDPTAVAFIDMLGQLLVDPGSFAHEPTFLAPVKSETQ